MRKGTITSISIIAGTALGAALIGILGVYIALPKVAPSMATSDGGGTQAAPAGDSTASPAPMADSAGRSSAAEAGRAAATARGASGAGPPSAGTAAGDSAMRARLQALRDSARTLNRRLQDTQRTADTLRRKMAEADTAQEKVNKLSDALMEMRKRNLGSLLKKVDMSVLKKLYQQSSGDARARLLQSMTPGQAAQFVNQVVEDPQSSSPSESDSSSSTE
jgi:flagellar motility protein MotE (MotC chaperone)